MINLLLVLGIFILGAEGNNFLSFNRVIYFTFNWNGFKNAFELFYYLK